MESEMNTATRYTTLFVFYKAMVAEAAGLPIEAIQPFIARLGAAFDMGEPVWMIADEIKLRANAPKKMKTPRQLAVSVHTVPDATSSERLRAMFNSPEERYATARAARADK